MELTKEMIKDAIKRKGITELELCNAVGYSQPSLHRFYSSGKIRARNAKKIIEFIEQDAKNTNNTQVERSIPDTGMFDRLIKRIEELTIENFTLKKELGKFDGAYFALGA
ncbi:hypothetical protein [Flectobacillus longus]|uniref:hypothetical protein n=1 Tax=Flectobacillus longus TaxID=2984207 RepID=UPI0024B73495|nr:hypothetical protein [Flectobacillus longus]MDI9878926.1 hypothetical protein [Flectobacillus longus]